MITLPDKASKPTMYFIGVTTGQSSIMKVFPKWAEALQIDATIKGIDIGIRAPKEEYRSCVEFIKNDPLSMGALVTTHKMDLYEAAKDLFEYMDPYAEQFHELSSISKLDGKLCGHAKDPISVGLALDAFLPKDHWKRYPQAEVVVLGSGGSALAIASYLAHPKHGDHVPARIHLTNRSAKRLAEAVSILQDSRVPLSYHLSPVPRLNDLIVQRLPVGSMVVNATGLGKDRPGSPLTDDCPFPEDGIVWEFNYRGTLEFMHQAEAQQKERNLLIEDGWVYFIHGWTQVIAEVFHVDITGDRLKMCDEIASVIR